VTRTDNSQVDAALPSSSAQYDRSVLANLFEKIELTPVSKVRPLEGFQDNDALFRSPVDERLMRALGVLFEVLAESGRPVGSLDKSLLDFHIDALDRRVNRCLDTVMHSTQFQTIESAWRGLKFLVDHTDFRKNVKIEVLDCSKETLQQDFDDTPEVIQSGLYHHAYIQEYDTPGGQPISAIISDFEFVNSAKDIALLRNISKTCWLVILVFASSLVCNTPSFIKTILFGFAIGFVGCYKGFNSNRGTESVGLAANSAVVTASVWIIVIDAIVVQITNTFVYS